MLYTRSLFPAPVVVLPIHAWAKMRDQNIRKKWSIPDGDSESSGRRELHHDKAAERGESSGRAKTGFAAVKIAVWAGIPDKSVSSQGEKARRRVMEWRTSAEFWATHEKER